MVKQTNNQALYYNLKLRRVGVAIVAVEKL